MKVGFSSVAEQLDQVFTEATEFALPFMSTSLKKYWQLKKKNLANITYLTDFPGDSDLAFLWRYIKPTWILLCISI